jgi:hypothetical protein
MRLAPHLKRAPAKGRPRQLFSVDDIVTIAVFRSLVEDLRVDRKEAARMVASLARADVGMVMRKYREMGMEIPCLQVAALGDFIDGLNKDGRGERKLDKAVRAKHRKTRLYIAGCASTQNGRANARYKPLDSFYRRQKRRLETTIIHRFKR